MMVRCFKLKGPVTNTTVRLHRPTCHHVRKVAAQDKIEYAAGVVIRADVIPLCRVCKPEVQELQVPEAEAPRVGFRVAR
jgi:hypothetical protein